MIGQAIAHYKVTAKLGAGGMGEVYRATDSKLGRDVALKVLPPAFAQDAQRMQRFEREAQVLASLNHPNIAAIYGLEHHDQMQALVMELVEGPTLAERIAQGKIPVEEALPIAKQIAEALEYAHEKGIVHRDLKPANIKLTPDGKVKVLDFGLAKALAEDPVSGADLTNSPTLSVAATKAGVILGTAAYMAPEQARGKPVDKRADVWSFGVVLHEMLSGQRLFAGETASDSLALILARDVDFSALPAATPVAIRRLLQRCLTKDARQRLQAIGEARIAIEEVIAHPESLASSVTSQAGATSTIAAPAWENILPWAAAGVLALVAAWGWMRQAPTLTPVVRRFVTALPTGQGFYGPKPDVAISRDGRRVAYVATRIGGSGWQLYVRSMDRMDAVPLGNEDGESPFFSPDGEWVGYFSGGKMRKISVHGGAAVTLADAASPRGASWGPDNTIVFSPVADGGLARVSGDGGKVERLSKGEDGGNIPSRQRWPDILPGGQSVLFAESLTGGSFDRGTIQVMSLRTGERKRLLEGATAPKYVPGYLVYAQARTLYAVPFDAERLELQGTPVPVVQDVQSDATMGASYYNVSQEGTLVYLLGDGTFNVSRMVWVDRAGKETAVAAPPRTYSHLRLSPEGTRVAVRMADPNVDIWTYGLTRGALSRFTFQPEEDESAVWSPDGLRLYYSSSLADGERAILRRNADGSGTEEILWKGPGHTHANAVSPDERWLIYTLFEGATRGDLWVLPLAGERKPQAYAKTDFNEYDAAFSPDGKWVVYTSDESGQNEVYVQPFPAAGGKWQISTTGGDSALWSRNGKEIFFRHDSQMMAVSVTTSPSFAPAAPRLLFDGAFAENPRREVNYGVSPDSQRFLMLKGDTFGMLSSGQYHVVVNWLEELKRLAPPGKK